MQDLAFGKEVDNFYTRDSKGGDISITNETNLALSNYALKKNTRCKTLHFHQ